MIGFRIATIASASAGVTSRIDRSMDAQVLQHLGCNAECRMQNAECKRSPFLGTAQSLHSEFCILNYSQAKFHRPALRRPSSDVAGRPASESRQLEKAFVP